MGAEVDENLAGKNIGTICKKASAGIGAIRCLKPYVPVYTLPTIHKALVQPYFDYWSPLWDNCGKLLPDKLRKFQSRAARVITGASYDVRSVDILKYPVVGNSECEKILYQISIYEQNT